MKKSFSRIFITSILFWLAAAYAVAQQTYFVKADASTDGDGKSWDTAMKLETALAQAVAGDKIMVRGYSQEELSPSTMYYAPSGGFKIKSGVQVYGGFAGTETFYDNKISYNGSRFNHVYQSALVADAQANDAVDADVLIYPDNKTRADNSVHVVVMDLGPSDGNTNDGNQTTILKGFSIAAGNAMGNSDSNDGHGGGVLVVNSSTKDNNSANRTYEISECYFVNNYARRGGAIYVDATASNKTSSIQYCAFYNNVAGYRSGNENAGGGLWIDGGGTVSNSVVLNNTNGGVRISQNARVVNCTVVHNSISAADLVSPRTESGSADGGTLYNTVLWGSTTLSKTATIPTFRYCAYPEVTVTNTTEGTDDNHNKKISYQNFSEEPSAWFITPSSTVGYDRSFKTHAGAIPSYSVEFEEQSALLDAGSKEYYNNIVGSSNDKDLAGNNRFDEVSSTIDIGAYERERIPVTRHRYVMEKAQGTGDGTSWDNATDNLQSAINDLYGDGTRGKGEVWVAAGTYQPKAHMEANNDNSPFAFQMRDGINVIGGFVGGEQKITERKTLDNFWEFEHPTILQGYKYNSQQTSFSQTDGWNVSSDSYHVVWFAPAPGASSTFKYSTILDGVTVEGGSCTSQSTSSIDSKYAPYHGAGVYMSDGNALLRNCIVRNNNANMSSQNIDSKGGGVYCQGGQVRYSLVYNNSAVSGGGIYLETVGFVNNCMVSNNSAYNGSGVYLKQTGDIYPLYQILATSVISNNTSLVNGAVYLDGSGLVEQNTIVNNYTSGSKDEGDTETTETGGLYINKQGIVINNIIWNNILLSGLGNNSANAQIYAGKNATRETALFYNNAISDVNAATWNNCYQTGTYEMNTTYTGRNFQTVSGSQYATAEDINNLVGVQEKWTAIDYYWTLRQGAPLRSRGILYAEIPQELVFKPCIDLKERNFESCPPIGAYTGEGNTYVFQLIPSSTQGNRLRLYFDKSSTATEGNGSSWTNVITSINQALNYISGLSEGSKVNTSTDEEYTLTAGDSIEICSREGTITPITPYTFQENEAKAKTVMIPATNFPVIIRGGYPAYERMTVPADTDRNPKLYRTEFNGNPNGTAISDGLHHIFRIETGANVTLDGIAITHGYAAGTASTPYGGGVLIGSTYAIDKPTYVKLTNCIIEDNAALHGAAFGTMTDAKDVHLTLENCVVNNNTCLTEKLADSQKGQDDINGKIFESNNDASNVLTLLHTTIVNNIGIIPSQAELGNSSFAAGNYIYNSNEELVLDTNNNTHDLATLDAKGASNFNNPTKEAGAHLSGNVYLGGNAEFRPLTSSDETSDIINKAKDSNYELTTDINGEPRDLGGRPDLGAYEAILPKAGKVIYVRSYNTEWIGNDDKDKSEIDGTPDFDLLNKNTDVVYDGSTWENAIMGNAVCNISQLDATDNSFYVRKEDGKLMAATLEESAYADYVIPRLRTAPYYGPVSGHYTHFLRNDWIGNYTNHSKYTNWTQADEDLSFIEYQDNTNQYDWDGDKNGTDQNGQSKTEKNFNAINNNRDEQYVSGLQFAVEKAAAENAKHKNEAGYEPIAVWVGAGVYTDCKGFVIRDGVKVYGGFPHEGNPDEEDRLPLLSQYIPAREEFKNTQKSKYETILQIRKKSPVYRDSKDVLQYTTGTSNGPEKTVEEMITEATKQNGKTMPSVQRHYVLYQPDVCVPTWSVTAGNTKTEMVKSDKYRYMGTCKDDLNWERYTHGNAASIYKDYSNVKWDGFTIRHGYIINYTANRDGGAGVRVFRGVELENLVIVDNLAHGYRNRGGGLYMDGENSKISNSFILNNLATDAASTNMTNWKDPLGANLGSSNNCDTYGGGAYMIVGTGFNMVVAKNRVISSNSGGRNKGGGIFIEKATFYNNTVAYNMSNGASSGIMQWSTKEAGIVSNLSLYNCIIYGNKSQAGWQVAQIESSSIGNFQPAHNCYLAGQLKEESTNKYFTESKFSTENGNITDENLPNPFADGDNAINTLNFRLADNSQCLNTGTDDLNQDKTEEQEIVDIPSTDMDFTDRIKDCTIDIGAYESNNEANITPETIKNVEGATGREDIDDYVYYVTQNGYGNRSGSSPANAACADKLQSVLTAAGKKFIKANEGLKLGVANNHQDDAKAHKVYVKVAGYQSDESGDRFVYHANTQASANDPLSYTFLIPNGVWLMGGYNEGTPENGVPKPSTYNWYQNQRDITSYQTVLSAKTELKSGSAVEQEVNGYHTVTFGAWPSGDLDAYNDTAISYRACIDGVYLQDGKATDNANGKSMGGGAIVPKSAHVRNCIISGSEALYGGALYLLQGGMATGSLIMNNAAKQGGGVYAACGRVKDGTSDYHAYMANNHVVANEATIGGGIYQELGSLMTGNTIIWGNTATTDKNISGVVNQRFPDQVQGAFSQNVKAASMEFYPYNACFVERYTLDSDIGNTSMTSDLDSYFTNEGDYYPRPYSALVGKGVPSDYQQAWLSIGVEAWDIKGIIRNATGRLTAGAYAMSLPEIEEGKLLKRLFVSQNGGVNISEEDRNQYVGRSFYTPFNSLDAALSYIHEARSKHIGGAQDDTPFEILMSGGTYTPSMYPVKDVDYKTDRRFQTFHIPRNVSIYGSFSYLDTYSSDPEGTAETDRLTTLKDKDGKTITLKPGGEIKDLLAERNTNNVSDRNSNGLLEPWEFTNWTILSGNIKASEQEKHVYHVVYSEEPDSDESSADRNNDVVLDGITIMDGETKDKLEDDGKDEIQSEVGHGGGIYSKNVSYTLNRCRVIRNIGVHGGGIYLKDGSLDIINSAISGNWAGSEDNIFEVGEGRGGGVYAYFSGTRKGNIHVINSLFANNTAANNSTSGGAGTGGAIYIRRAADLNDESNKDYTSASIMNSLIVNNQANHDAAVALEENVASSEGINKPIILVNTVLWNNKDNLHALDRTNMYHCASDKLDKSAARDGNGNIVLDTENTSTTGPRFKAPSTGVGKDYFTIGAKWNPAAISILTDAGAGVINTEGTETGAYKTWWDLHSKRLESAGYLQDYIKTVDGSTYARYQGPKAEDGTESNKTIDIGLYEFQYPAFDTNNRNALYIGTTDEGKHDGSSWANQSTDLRGAIIAMANATGNTGTDDLSTTRKVYVQSGEYYSPNTTSSTAYTLAINNKDESKDYVKKVELVGACTRKTLSDGTEEQDFSDQTVIVPNEKSETKTDVLLSITTNGKPVTISGFTFKNTYENATGTGGIGIKANVNNYHEDTEASLTLKNCGFVQNDDKAMEITNNDGKVLIYNTLFADNKKEGLVANKNTGDNASVTVLNVTFANNGTNNGESDISTDNASKVHVYNTLSWKNGSSILSGSDTDYETNGNKLYAKNTTIANDDVLQGPNFTDPDNENVSLRDYSIRPSLQLLNKGKNDLYTEKVSINQILARNWMNEEKDFGNKDRVTGNLIDIGAYECDSKLQPIIYVKKGAESNGTGESWDSPYINLQSAINLAELYANTENGQDYAYVFVHNNTEASNINITLPGVKVYGTMDNEKADATLQAAMDATQSAENIKAVVDDILSKRKGTIEAISQSKLNGLSMKYTINTNGATNGASTAPSVVDGFAVSGLVDMNNGYLSSSLLDKGCVVDNSSQNSSSESSNNYGTLYNSLSYGTVKNVRAVNVTAIANGEITGELPNIEGSANNRPKVSTKNRYVSAANWCYQLDENSADLNKANTSEADAKAAEEITQVCIDWVGHDKDLAGNQRIRNQVDNGCFETWYLPESYEAKAKDYPHGKSVVYVAGESSDAQYKDPLTQTRFHELRLAEGLYPNNANAFSPGFLLLGHHAGLRGNGNYISIDTLAVERDLKGDYFDICALPFRSYKQEQFVNGALINEDYNNRSFRYMSYNGAVRAAYDYKFDANGTEANGMSKAWNNGEPSGARLTDGMLITSTRDQTVRFYGANYTENGKTLANVTLVQNNNQQPWSEGNSEGVKMTHKENMGWNLFGSPYLCAMNFKDMEYGRVIYVNAIEQDGNEKISSGYKTINTDGKESGYIPTMDAVFTQTATLSASNTESFTIDHSSKLIGSPYDDSQSQSVKVMLTQAKSIETSTRANAEESLAAYDEMKFNAVSTAEANRDYDLATDGVKWMMAGKPNIYIERNGGRYSLLSAVNIEGSLNIGVSLPAAGSYSLSIPEDCDVSKYETVWLKDQETGKAVDLLEGKYDFNATQAGEMNSRFVISFNRMADDLKDAISISSGEHGVIKVEGTKSNDQIRIYMASGLLATQKTAKGNSESIRTTANGTVIVEVTRGGKQVAVRKMAVR